MKSIFTTLISKPFCVLAAALVCVLAAACSKTDEPEPPGLDEPISRTVMVYMVANNSLGAGRLDYADINEMRNAVVDGALDNGGRLLLYHEAFDKRPVLMEMTADGTLDTLAVSPAGARGTDVAELKTSLQNMRALAPADSYGLILWSHGNGWIENGSTSASPISTLAFGQSGSRTMNVTDLASTIEECGPVEFIHFDCCYMMGVEVVYELRHAAGRISGSVTELPACGMPYDLTLPYFFSPGSEADLKGAAQATFEFFDKKKGQDRTCTMSVVRTRDMDALAQATAALYSRCHTGMPLNVQAYGTKEFAFCFYDFGDYCDRIAAEAGCQAELQAVKAALADVVIYSVATPKLWDSLPLDRHCGLSTRILSSRQAAFDYRHYTSLQWWQDVASRLTDNPDLL